MILLRFCCIAICLSVARLISVWSILILQILWQYNIHQRNFNMDVFYLIWYILKSCNKAISRRNAIKEISFYWPQFFSSLKIIGILYYCRSRIYMITQSCTNNFQLSWNYVFGMTPLKLSKGNLTKGKTHSKHVV